MKQEIHCGELFVPELGKVEKNMSILVEDNHIVDIYEMGKTPVEVEKVINLTAEFVMPGLIDSHVHTSLDGGSTYGNRKITLTLGDIAFASRISAIKDLLAGFTTIRDEGSVGYVDVALRNAINTGKTEGPRMFVSGMPLTATGGHSDSRFNPYVTGTWGITSCTVDSPDEARKAVRYNLKYGADQIKIMATGGVMSAGDPPSSAEFTEAEMKAILEVVKGRGRISSAHAHGADGIKMAVRCGITSIEHGMLMDDECVDMMAEAGTYLIPTIIAGDSIVKMGTKGGLTEESVEKAKVCLAQHADHLKKCRSKGVKVVFGTDAGTPGNEHGKQAYEFELMAEAGGFSVTELLLSATKTPAEMMHKGNEIGCLKKGSFADIIAMKTSPYTDVKALQNVSFVMKDGQIYKNL